MADSIDFVGEYLEANKDQLAQLVITDGVADVFISKVASIEDIIGTTAGIIKTLNEEGNVVTRYIMEDVDGNLHFLSLPRIRLNHIQIRLVGRPTNMH